MESKYLVVLLISGAIFIFGGCILRFFSNNMVLCSVITLIGWLQFLALSVNRLIVDKKRKNEQRKDKQ